jgi:hypothetical protein
VREYLLDVLAEYAPLQRFTPHPSEGAVLVTAEFLLEQFLYQKDKDVLLEAHPWLNCKLQQGL